MSLPSFQLVAVTSALIGNAFLGLFTYLKNPKSSTNRLFFLFTAALGLYLFLNFSATRQNSDTATLLFIRTVMSLGLIINLLFFLLATTFPFAKPPLSSKKIWLLVFLTIIILPATQGNFVFSGLKSGTTQPIPGPAMPIFLLHTLIFLGGGILALVKKFRHSAGITKTQMRLLLFGTLLMFGAIFVSNVILVVVFNTTALVDLLPAYTLIFAGFISYAIVRHRFLDIGVLVARTVTYTVVVGLIAVLYAALIFTASQVFSEFKPSQSQLIFFIILTVIIAVSFQRIVSLINKVTNKLFFKGAYSIDKVLQQLGRTMASIIQLEPLCRDLLKNLLYQVHLSRGAFILLEDENISDIYSEGFAQNLQITTDQLKALTSTTRALVFDELDEGYLKETLRILGISLVIQLFSGQTRIGMLALGPKASGDIFSEQDLSLLEILAPEAAVAIQNSQSYEKIRRFNLTLQDEVNKATAELKEANQHLRELDKMKDEFVSLASHELRTPMTAIKSYVWMVQNGKAGPISATAKKDLDIVYESTERLLHLVNDMLDISRIESGKVQLHLETFDFAALAQLLFTEFSAKAAERKMDWQINIAKGLPAITADKDKIMQVLENLVGNAFKFTPDEGRVTLSAQIISESLSVSITDSGKGIAEADIPKLFTKFTRLGDITTYSQPGTGLGLYLSKQYVELHRGQISVTSRLGSGTTFTFTLPLGNIK